MDRVGDVGVPLLSVWRGLLWDGCPAVAPPRCLFGAEYDEPYLWDAIDVETGSRIAVAEAPANLRLIAVAPTGFSLCPPTSSP
jgi:hypothetical protein